MRIFFWLIPFSGLLGLPSNGVVVQGSGSIREIDALQIEISASDQAVFEWNRFSLLETEGARFIQPHSDAVVLNRIVGNGPSFIDGVLESNGKVILINLDGILIGKQGRIDTRSFIACAAPLSNEALFRGNYDSISGGGSVANLGTILARGGEAALIGSEIKQMGHIDVSDPFERGGQVFLSAIGGGIEIGGIVSASGNIGGEIEIRSKIAYVHPEASIEAFGRIGGGDVRLISDYCFHYGQILALGSSKGGSVEVSGAHFLDFRGKVDAHGSIPGSLLIDPTDIEIGSFPTTPPPFSYPPPHMIFDRPGPTAFLDSADLISQLNQGTNVTVRTTPGAGGPFGGRISVTAPVLWYTAANLTLIADEDIQILSDLGSFGNAQIVLTAAGDIVLKSALFQPSTIRTQGNIEMQASGLLLAAMETPAEISSYNGHIEITLSGDLSLTGGLGGTAGAYSRLAASSIDASIGGSLIAAGGDGADCFAEISHYGLSGLFDIDVGALIDFDGGMGPGARASLISGGPLDLRVGDGATLSSGLGGSAGIGSRFNTAIIEVGINGPADLRLEGNMMTGFATIEGNGDVSILSSRDVHLDLGKISSSGGLLDIDAAGDAVFINFSEISSQFGTHAAASLLAFDQSRLVSNIGIVSLDGGDIRFQNGADIALPLGASLIGSSLLIDGSSVQGGGQWLFQFTGDISCLNSSMIGGAPTIALSADNIGIDQSVFSAMSLNASASGALSLMNGGALHFHTEGIIACASASLSMGSITGANLTLGASGSVSLSSGSSIQMAGPILISGMDLAIDASAVVSQAATLGLDFLNMVQCMNGSLMSCPSDFTFNAGAASIDQTLVQSLSGSLNFTSSGAVSLLQQTLLSAAQLNFASAGFTLDNSSIQGNYVQIQSSVGGSLSNQSGIGGFSVLDVMAATLLSLDMSTFQGSQIQISAAMLQMNDSTIQAGQSFNVQAAAYSLMNSTIIDPLSTLGSP